MSLFPVAQPLTTLFYALLRAFAQNVALYVLRSFAQNRVESRRVAEKTESKGKGRRIVIISKRICNETRKHMPQANF